MNGSIFEKIGELTLDGRISAYSFIDNIVTAINYYRLRMVDKDNKFSFSKVIKLTRLELNAATAVWPNPFHKDINVELELHQNQQVDFRLLSESGHLVKYVRLLGHKGANIFNIDITKKLITATYILEIRTNNGVIQQKLICVTN